MDTIELYVYNFVSNDAMVIYSLCLESYDLGLSNKPK